MEKILNLKIKEDEEIIKIKINILIHIIMQKLLKTIYPKKIFLLI